MQKTLLIVDDLAANRRILINILSRDYTILEASGGAEAEELLSRHGDSVSAVLLDILMPDVDGYEVLRRMRASDRLAQIPVIMITGSGDEEARVKSLAFGANDFVTKPYNPDIIRHCLRNNISLCEAASAIMEMQRDKLTGLFTRESFCERAGELIRAREPGYYVISCLNVDGFKVINDQYGSVRGDGVLKHIARYLTRWADGNGGLCSRITADQFAIIYPAALIGSDSIKENHRDVSRPGCIDHAITIRVGRYVVNDLSLTPSAMYDRATLAEASIKGHYDAYIADYDESMRDKLLREQRVVNEMNSALQNRQFEVWFQAQYDHATGAGTGAEALVRWHHPESGLIPPYHFIPIFEQNGFIYELDKYVWDETCRYLRKWTDEGRDPLPVSVNISRQDIFHPDIVEYISGLVEKYGIPVELLRLEITESAFAKSTEQIVATVKKLISLGFIVEIDDFGSGYSSLNTLKCVPAQVLKLDMRFLEGDNDSQRGGNIIESIIRMAKWLDMTVIAEGVETVEQADFLRTIGCTCIQGYLYAKPVPAEEYENASRSIRKEKQLISMQTVGNLDNNSFWDPKSLDSLVFNSYVGAACVFEYYEGRLELVRATDKYAEMIKSAGMSLEDAMKLDWAKHVDLGDSAEIISALKKALPLKEEINGDYKLIDLPGCSKEIYLRSSMRAIASVGGRYLVYCTNEDITAQRLAEKKEQDTERKRRFAAERLQAIMDNVSGGIVAALVTEDSICTVFTNNRYYEIFGYTETEFAERFEDPFMPVCPEDAERVYSAMREAVATEKPAKIEYKALCRDCTEIWIRHRMSVTRFAGIDAPILLSVIYDVSSEKSALRRSEQSAEQLRAIMTNINGGVTVSVVKESGASILYSNDRYYEQLGYTRRQFAAEVASPFSLVHPEDREAVMKQTTEASRTRMPFACRYRVIRRDRTVRWMLSNISIMSYPGTDEPVQLAVANDVTEQHEAEMNERRASDQLQTIMEDAGSGITAAVLVEGEPDFLFANDKYYEILGYTRGEYITEVDDPYDLINESDREMVREVSVGAYESGITTQMEYRIIRRDGNERWVRSIISSTRFSGEDDNVQLGVFTDITEMKRDEHERERTAELLQFLNETAHELLAQPDAEKGIVHTLGKLLDYCCGDRAYVYETDCDSGEISNTYEVCADGVEPEKNSLQKLSPDVVGFWLSAFADRNYISIADVNALDDSRPEKEALQRQGITSLMAVPLRRDGALIGFIGVDNPRSHFGRLDRLAALGDYIAVMLTRRDLIAKLSESDRNLATMMNDIPGGFARVKIGEDGALKTVYCNDGLCRLLGMSRAEALAAYGTDAMAGVHPDDTEIVRGAVRRMLETGEAGSASYRLRGGDGKYIRLNIFGRVTVGGSGDKFLNVYYINASMTDRS